MIDKLLKQHQRGRIPQRQLFIGISSPIVGEEPTEYHKLIFENLSKEQFEHFVIWLETMTYEDIPRFWVRGPTLNEDEFAALRAWYNNHKIQLKNLRFNPMGH